MNQILQNNITILTASRRPSGYKKLLEQLEAQIPELIQNYIVLVDDAEILPQYKELKNIYNKVKIINVPHNYIYKNGFDVVYNLLASAAKTEYVWLLFDTDTVEIQKEKFLIDLEASPDIFAYPTYMQRGDAHETKMQLYKKDCLRWEGLLHEIQVFLRQPLIAQTQNINVIHNNAIDSESKDIKKTNDGFLILEPTIEGSDSWKRNVLYESLAWKIANGLSYHKYEGWFKRHYEINKIEIDKYHDIAEKIYKD